MIQIKTQGRELFFRTRDADAGHVIDIYTSQVLCCSVCSAMRSRHSNLLNESVNIKNKVGTLKKRIKMF